MYKDSRGRRLRWRARNPEGVCEIGSRDLHIFEAIHHHGYSASHYLHALVGGEKNAFQKRLGQLYDFGYLQRFKEQEDSFVRRLRHIIYGLTDKSRQHLTDAGRFVPFYDRTDPFEHRFMGACVSASIELECRALGLKYIPRSEVLSKKNKPLRIPLPHFGEKTYLEPDDLFGIQYPDGSYRRFAVEIDRSNEPLEGQNRHSSIEKKFDYYEYLIKERVYHEVWGIPGLMLLFITTSQKRVDHIKDDIKERSTAFASRAALKAYPTFAGRNWLIPPTTLTDILTPWDTVQGPFDITKP